MSANTVPRPGRALLLDSNLLLLLLIGTFRRDFVTSFKRTALFTLADLDLLTSIVSRFNTLLTTPHLLTEVNSLANSLPEYIQSDWCEHFATQTARFTERLQPATAIMHASVFNPFGLADAAIQAAHTGALILTEDRRLSGILARQGIHILNFRDLAQTSQAAGGR